MTTTSRGALPQVSGDRASGGDSSATAVSGVLSLPTAVPSAVSVAFDPQEQLSIPQVARLLQCSERWLYGKVRDGELHATHLGRAVRVSRANLQRFLDSRQAWRPPGSAA